MKTVFVFVSFFKKQTKQIKQQQKNPNQTTITKKNPTPNLTFSYMVGSWENLFGHLSHAWDFT